MSWLFFHSLFSSIYPGPAVVFKAGCGPHVYCSTPGPSVNSVHCRLAVVDAACLVPRRRCESEEKGGSAGLNGKGTNLSLEQSHNSTGTALNDPTTQWAPHSKRERRLGRGSDAAGTRAFYSHICTSSPKGSKQIIHFRAYFPVLYCLRICDEHIIITFVGFPGRITMLGRSKNNHFVQIHTERLPQRLAKSSVQHSNPPNLLSCSSLGEKTRYRFCCWYSLILQMSLGFKMLLQK